MTTTHPRIAEDTARCVAVNRGANSAAHPQRRGDRCRRHAQTVVAGQPLCTWHARMAQGEPGGDNRRKLTLAQISALRAVYGPVLAPTPGYRAGPATCIDEGLLPLKSVARALGVGHATLSRAVRGLSYQQTPR